MPDQEQPPVRKKVPSFDEVMKEHKKKIPSYDEVMSSSKKKDLTDGSSVSEGGGLNGTTSTTVSDEQLPVVPLENNLQEDIFELSKKYEDLSNKKVVPSEKEMGMSMGMAQPYPYAGEVSKEPIGIEGVRQNKIGGTEEATALRDYMINEKGIDPVELNDEVKGLDSNDFAKEGFSKQQLLADREENKQLYDRKLGRLKWQKGLQASLDDALINKDISKDEYDSIDNAVSSSLKNASVGDYEQQRQNINTVASTISKYGGEKSDELLKNYAVEVGKVYGNAWKNNFETAAKNSPESKYLSSPEAILGYQYLKDVSPEKAQQYERLFIDPNEVKKLSPDEKKGYDHLMQVLEETGIGLQKNAVEEEINNLGNIAKKNNGLIPDQLSLASQLQQKSDELSKQSDELDNKYPDRLVNKIDDAVQELMGQRNGFFQYTLGKGAQSIKNTGKGIWESVSSPFMSDASNKLRELAIMGESMDEEGMFHKTDANKSLQYDQIIFKPELKKQVDEILNNKSLSEDKKRGDLYRLLAEHKDEFGRVPLQNGKFNLNPSSILYGVSDIATTLLPFVALEAATGGGATAGLTRKFLSTATAAFATGFHDEYANAIKEGKSESDAYRYAMGVTAISAAAMAGANTPEKIKSFFKPNTSSYDVVKNMSDEAIEAIIKKPNKEIKLFGKDIQPLVQNAKQRLQKLPSDLKEGAKAGLQFEGAMTAADELKHQIYNTDIDRKERFKQSILGVLNFPILSGVIGQSAFRNKTELQKGALLRLGEKPEDYKKQLDVMLSQKRLTPDEYNQIKDNIDYAEQSYKNIPATKTNGKPFTEKEKADYIYNEMVQRAISKKKLPPKMQEEADFTSLVAAHKNDIIASAPTDKQLQSRLSKIEKELTPEKKEDGTIIPIDEKTKNTLEAEKEAINDELEMRSKGVQVEAPKEIPESIEIKNAEPESNKPISEEVQSTIPTEKESTTEGKPSEAVRETTIGEEKAKEIAEAEKPPVDIKFDLRDEDFMKSDEPVAMKKQYIQLKKEHALLKRIIKDCL